MKQMLAGWIGHCSDRNRHRQNLTLMLHPQERGDFSNLSHEQGFLFASGQSTVQQDDIWLTLMGAPSSLSKSDLLDLLDGYQKKGLAFLTQIHFGFALVLFDFKQQTLVLATDPMGQRSMYYHKTQDGLVFGASADQVRTYPGINPQISEQSLYDYVYFHHCPSPKTIYRDIQKLENGQVLSWQQGKISRQFYWLPKFSEHPLSNPAEAGERLKSSLIASVTKYAGSSHNFGAFLSGGLDSSSVAGAMAKAFEQPVNTFSMGFNAEGYDEIEYARIAVKHFGLIAHEYYITPEDTVAAVAEIAAFYDEPFGNSSALAAYYCAKLAREHGVTLLLAGDGGDELFAGNERYARQLLFERFARLPGFARATLSGLAPVLPSSIGLLHKVKRYVEQAKTPLPDRLQDYNFLNRHSPEEIFQADFLASIDTEAPLRQWRETYHRPEDASALNRMLYLDWKSTLHDNDLVKVNKTCELAGVDVQYPMLDTDIIELSCAIPSAMKLKPGQLRWFYKQAMRGFLPDAIINKTKHGFGLPFGLWLKDYQPLRELAYDNLQDLKKRPFFAPGFIDHAIAMHGSVHAVYYGELIWILMMLELWFKDKKL